MAVIQQHLENINIDVNTVKSNGLNWNELKHTGNIKNIKVKPLLKLKFLHRLTNSHSKEWRYWSHSRSDWVEVEMQFFSITLLQVFMWSTRSEQWQMQQQVISETLTKTRRIASVMFFKSALKSEIYCWSYACLNNCN